MTDLCLVAGLLVAALGDAATLRWTHSIEKIVWEEDYRLEAGQLRLVEARIRGTGAGMEPPAGAVLRDGVWHYVPDPSMLPELRLAHSPHAAPYVLCAKAGCRDIDEWMPGLPAHAVPRLVPCPAHPG